MDKLKCSMCQQMLPDEDFARGQNKSRRNRQSRCNACHRQWQHDHRATLHPTDIQLHRMADKYRPKAS